MYNEDVTYFFGEHYMSAAVNNFFDKPIFNNQVMNYKVWKDVTVKKLLILFLIVF